MRTEAYIVILRDFEAKIEDLRTCMNYAVLESKKANPHSWQSRISSSESELRDSMMRVNAMSLTPAQSVETARRLKIVSRKFSNAQKAYLLHFCLNPNADISRSLFTIMIRRIEKMHDSKEGRLRMLPHLVILWDFELKSEKLRRMQEDAIYDRGHDWVGDRPMNRASLELYDAQRRIDKMDLSPEQVALVVAKLKELSNKFHTAHLAYCKHFHLRPTYGHKRSDYTARIRRIERIHGK